MATARTCKCSLATYPTVPTREIYTSKGADAQKMNAIFTRGAPRGDAL